MAAGNHHPEDPLRNAGVSDVTMMMMMFLLRLPGSHDGLNTSVLQLLNALTPMCCRTETSCRLWRGTMCTTRPRASATLDTQGKAHPIVYAYQMGSGAAPRPSVAGTVSPEQPHIWVWDRSSLAIVSQPVFGLFLLQPQRTIVLIRESPPAPQERATFSELAIL